MDLISPLSSFFVTVSSSAKCWRKQGLWQLCVCLTGRGKGLYPKMSGGSTQVILGSARMKMQVEWKAREFVYPSAWKFWIQWPDLCGQMCTEDTTKKMRPWVCQRGLRFCILLDLRLWSEQKLNNLWRWPLRCHMSWFFLKQYGFFNTQKGTDTGAELSSFYSRREYLKRFRKKGALFIHFESALNLTSQHHSIFAMKNKSSVCTESGVRRNKTFTQASVKDHTSLWF